MICPKCGKNTILKTCPDCGSATVPESGNNTKTYTQGSWFSFGLKFAIGAILIILGIFFMASIGMRWYTIYFIAVGIVLIFWAIIKRPVKKTIVQQMNTSAKKSYPKSSTQNTLRSSTPSYTAPKSAIINPNAHPTADQRTKNPMDEMQKYRFEGVVENYVLRYQYENKILLNDCTPESLSGKGGTFLDFKQETDNEYDSNAIAIYLEDKKIGYVYRGKTQDMINDWIKRKDLFFGYLNRIFVDEGNVTYKIGFYKPKDQFKVKSYALIKTSKKIDDFESRKDNLETCTEGDAIYAEYDISSESYVVFDEDGSEIGELPKSATTYFQGSGIDDVHGIISEFDYDENDKIKAKVDLYF